MTRKIDCYDTVQELIEGRRRVETRYIDKKMEELTFMYGSDDPCFPDGHKERINRNCKYQPKARARLTKLFAAFGLLVFTLIVLATAL